jgi:thioesterase domain-containing protein
MGGLVVYEMARRLEAAGREVRVAALLDTVHPEDLPESFGAEGVTENLFLRFFTGGRIAFSPAELAAIDPDARLDFLLEQIDGALPDGLPPGLDRDRLESLLAVVDANRRAMIAYRPGIYRGAVTYLRSGERAEGKLQRPDSAWQPLVEGGLTVEKIPGTHLSMHMPPHVVDLAAALRRAIDAEEGALVEG